MAVQTAERSSVFDLQDPLVLAMLGMYGVSGADGVPGKMGWQQFRGAMSEVLGGDEPGGQLGHLVESDCCVRAIKQLTTAARAANPQDGTVADPESPLSRQRLMEAALAVSVMGGADIDTEEALREANEVVDSIIGASGQSPTDLEGFKIRAGNAFLWLRLFQAELEHPSTAQYES